MTNFREAMHYFSEEAICSFQLLPNVGPCMNSLSQRQDITGWHWLASMYASSSITLPRSKLETKRLKGSGGGEDTPSSSILPPRTGFTILPVVVGKLLKLPGCFHTDFFILLCSLTLLIKKPLASVIPGKATYNYFIFRNSSNWSSTYNNSLTVGNYINEFKHSKYKMNLPFQNHSKVLATKSASACFPKAMK